LTTLFDLFGFVSVVLHGLHLVAQTLLLGSTAFVLSIVAVDAEHEPSAIAARSRRIIEAAALATVVTVIASTALNAIVLKASLGASWREIAGAAFVVAGVVKVLGAATIGLVVAIGPLSAVSNRIAIAVGAIVILFAAVATSHAVARLEDSGALAFATGAHELGAALWLGGLPGFWLALRRADSPATASRVGHRYSVLAASGVALIAGSAVVFAIAYIGSFAAVYGTAYGVMATTKSVLFAMLLSLGLANFLAVRRFAADPAAARRVRHFVEVEMGIGFAVLMAAASITSLPPGVDLVDGRVTLSDIVARMTPAWPRLASPDHATLALPALQARLDAEAQTAETASRPQAFVPGSSKAPPRNAYDVAWSEYNHHWAGLLVATMGLAALARRSGRAPWTRHWPLLFLLLAAFLFLRADGEVWPMGRIGLLESLKDPEVAQHRLFEILIVAFALFEWGVSTRRIVSRPLMRVFPLLTALGGTLLLTHSHALGNVKEELLIELTHLPIAVLGITAGWARWLEIEAPRAEGRWAGWLWPACFVAIGCLLVMYREA
jgi:putative copper resistance protein D